jgi:hypothetical protein
MKALTRTAPTDGCWLCSDTFGIVGRRRRPYDPAHPSLAFPFVRISSVKYVTVTPAGRRRYLDILASYLLRNRDVIDEHHWWLNTRVPEDVAYVHRLADRYPDFFRVVVKPMNHHLTLGGSIWAYLRECTDPDTIYTRFDDDICYMADDAIPNMRRFREENTEPFLVLGNIVNNAVCTHFFQRAGVVPTSWGVVGNECLDNFGWRSKSFARRLHRLFLKDLENGRQAKWQNVPMEIDGTSRFSINAISWYGRDLQGTAELDVDDIDEEPFLTAELPARLGRPNVVCAGALFGHYAFYTQRKYLERTSKDILARYRQIASQVVIPGESRRPLLLRTYEGLRWTAAETVWHTKYGVRHLGKKMSTRIKNSIPSRRAA